MLCISYHVIFCFEAFTFLFIFNEIKGHKMKYLKSQIKVPYNTIENAFKTIILETWNCLLNAILSLPLSLGRTSH